MLVEVMRVVGWGKKSFGVRVEVFCYVEVLLIFFIEVLIVVNCVYCEDL